MLWIALVHAIGLALIAWHPVAGLRLFGLIFLVLIPIAVIAGIRIAYAGLRVTEGKRIEPNDVLWKKSRNVLGSILWLALLQTLCLFGATLLLILPAIYLSLGFMFASLCLLDQGETGTNALATSLDLIRGRWWSTWWRIFAGIFLIMVPTVLVSSLLFGILGAVAGVDAVKATHPLVASAQTLFQGAIQTIVVPLVILFEVNVYRALKK